MRRAVAAAFLAFAVPGCFLFYGECGPTYHGLEWTDPGFYEELQDEKPVDARWTSAFGSLPWNHTWNVSLPPGTRLAAVTMWLPPPPGQAHGGLFDIPPPYVEEVGVEGDNVLVARVHGNVSDAELRVAFDRLVANVTTGLDVERAWAEFLASRTDNGARYGIPLDEKGERFEERIVWSHAADARGHVDADRLAERLNLPPPPDGGFGAVGTTAGDWAFSFALPFWSVSDGALTLKVDSADNVFVEGGSYDTEEEMREAAARLSRSIGHEPDLSEAQPLASIC